MEYICVLLYEYFFFSEASSIHELEENQLNIVSVWTYN